MIISTAHHDDMAALLALEEAGFEASERWSEASWQAELDNDQRLVLVSREHDQIEAVASFGVLDDTAELLRVIVAPERAGRGVARKLLSVGKQWAGQAGAERMLLEVRHDNMAALRLYQATGFEPIAQRPDYYGPGRHAVVMQAGLSRELAQSVRWG